MKRKYNQVDGTYSHLPNEIFGTDPRPEEWEHTLTWKQKVWIAVIGLLFVGLWAVAASYDYWWMANIG